MKTIQTEFCFENFKYSNDGVIHKIENNFLELRWRTAAVVAAIARQQILIIKNKTRKALREKQKITISPAFILLSFKKKRAYTFCIV